MCSLAGIQSSLHFLNSVSVGAVSNCFPPGSHKSSLLMSDIRWFPGIGGPVFSKHAHLIGILIRATVHLATGAQIQLVVTWDAISTALRNGPWKERKRTGGNGDGYDIKKAGSYNKIDFHGSFNYTQEPSSLPSPFEKALPSIVLVVGDGSWGSGIVLNNQGLILTSSHLLELGKFGKRPLHSQTDVTTFPDLSTLFICDQGKSDGRKGRQWSSPSLVKTMDGSVGDDHMAPKLDFIKKRHGTLLVHLDHMEPQVWCHARAVYVTKGLLDAALLQLEPVPNQLCPITPRFVFPSPASKVFVIGNGPPFGPQSGI